VIRNRVGDALIIGSLSILIFLNNLNLPFIAYTLNINYFIVLLIILIAGCTKRAQIPFRA
jgi:NADH:ubiquinone oxidoreductase subunit 5 (subunit L)/multisubunit Na+/H+ antiporter MnhA subunit